MELLVRKFELMRMRWGIEKRKVHCSDEATRDGALWWLDREIAEIEADEKQTAVDAMDFIFAKTLLIHLAIIL